MKLQLSRLIKPWLILGLIAITLTLTFQNCGQPRYGMNDPVQTLTSSQAVPTPADPNIPENIVCDPGASTTTSTGGLVAELYYMNWTGSANATTVMNFFDPAMATKSPQKIFFSQINTPPQIFNKGFVTKAGSVIKDDAGNNLQEWFALKFFSELRISKVEDEGLYEFASLSDDGHVFEAFIDGKWKKIIDDDGLHPPKWGCSSNMIELKKDVPVPIRVYYYQGPALHISNVLHWRKSAGISLGDKECGKYSTDYFYDAVTSTPQQPYKDLLTRGWIVVPPSVYFLPGTVVNPCTNF